MAENIHVYGRVAQSNESNVHWYQIPCFHVRARDISSARTLFYERTIGLTMLMRAHI